MTSERVSFFFRSRFQLSVTIFFCLVKKNEAKKGFSLLSGLGFSGIKNSKKHIHFISTKNTIHLATVGIIR